MAGKIKEGQSVYIPFVDGESALDSHFSTRVYKSPEQFEKSYHDGGDPKLVEYAPVVHGRWEDVDGDPVPWDDFDPGAPIRSAYCSVCGEWLTESDEYPSTGRYCPNCGVKMDLEG